MNLNDIQQLLDNPNRLTSLSTVDPRGRPNSALFGCVLIRDEQIIIGLGNGRSLHNLRQNQFATLMIVVPGENVFAFKGARLYLESQSVEATGPLLEEIQTTVRSTAGRAAARMIQHVLCFDILEYRDLVDMGAIFPAQ